MLALGAAGDLVCWPLEGIAFAGALTDPVEAWLRCGPVSARHTVVAGRVVVEDGALTVDGVDEMLAATGRSARESRACRSAVETIAATDTLRSVARRHPLLVALEPVAEALGATLVAAPRVQRGDIPLRVGGRGGRRSAAARACRERSTA